MSLKCANINLCHVCEKGPVEDEYCLLFICTMYSVIRKWYDNILRVGNDLSVMLKRTSRRLSSFLYALYTYEDIVLQSINRFALRKKLRINKTRALTSNGSILAFILLCFNTYIWFLSLMYGAKAQFHATMLWSGPVSMFYVLLHFLKRCFTEHPSVIYNIPSVKYVGLFSLFLIRDIYFSTF